MALSIGGNKSKSKGSQQQSFSQTQSLSPRAFGMLDTRLKELGQREYQALDPNAYKAYENPYQEEVIAATTADIDASRAHAGNEQRSQLARSAAFGDDRRGIMEAELEGQYDRTKATTLAGLRSRGYEHSSGIAQGENTNKNQYQAQLDALLNQLYGILGNETTTSGTSQGTSKGKTSGMNFGFSYGDD
jgi:hypothetical protein